MIRYVVELEWLCDTLEEFQGELRSGSLMRMLAEAKLEGFEIAVPPLIAIREGDVTRWITLRGELVEEQVHASKSAKKEKS